MPPGSLRATVTMAGRSRRSPMETGLDGVDDGARRPAFARHFGDRLVQVGVEFGAVRRDRLDAVIGQGRHELALGRLDAVDHAANLGIGGVAHRLGQMGEGAGEIVGDAQHVAGKAADRELLGVLALALAAAADVLGLGQRAQHPVLEVDVLRVQRRDDVGGMRFGGFAVFGIVAHCSS